MIGDNARKIIASSVDKPRLVRTLISTEYLTPEYGEIPTPENSFFYTEGMYKLAYTPTDNRFRPYRESKRFVLTLDFGNPIYIRFGSYENLLEQAAANPFVNFAVEMTNIKPEHLEFVKSNPNMRIGLSFDYIKYAQRVRERGGKLILDSFKED